MLTIKNKRTGTVWMLPTAVVVGMMLLAACGPQSTPTAGDGATAPAQNSGVATNAPATAVPATDAPAADPTDAPISFKNDVLPILQSRCVKCHGGQKTEKGLNVTDFQHLMAGSEKGPVVVASDAAASKMIQMVQQGKMPKMSAKLLPDQIQILVDWVNQGALDN